MSYKTVINCLKFSCVAIFLLFLQSAQAQPNRKNPKEVGTANFSELDELVQRNQKLLGGNAVALVWTDTLVYKRELGDLDSKTLVPLASCSKWLTTALVMKFVDEGLLSLDDKISKYLPIFELYGKNYITIRHCLSHYTGIQTDGGGIFGRRNFASLEAEVESYAKKEIKTNPGTDFAYSEIGLNIAGRILEVVSKKKFDMLIKQQLFNPLGMRKSTFGTMDNSAINPSGGGQSTADEYMHFLQMLLNNGKYNGQTFLSEESVRLMRQITTPSQQIRLAPKTVEGFSYTLGSWALEANGNEATALACPGLFGSWPMIDWCRGYACLFFVKTLPGEQKKEAYEEMKGAIDERLKKACK